jgi:hypothetical protein
MSDKNTKIPKWLARELETFLENFSDTHWKDAIQNAIRYNWNLSDFKVSMVGQALTLSWHLSPGKYLSPEEYILETILSSTEPEDFEQLDPSLWLY